MSTHFKRILYGGDYNPNQWPKDIWQGDMRIFKDAHIKYRDNQCIFMGKDPAIGA